MSMRIISALCEGGPLDGAMFRFVPQRAESHAFCVNWVGLAGVRGSYRYEAAAWVWHDEWAGPSKPPRARRPRDRYARRP